MRSFLIIIAGIFLYNNAVAQDTLRKREVSVTSTFKPTLREAAKINFNATPPNADTMRPRLAYELPNQNLLFAYQPGTLKPLALAVDSGGFWDNWNYAKVGYGTLKTPYFETGLSLGDGKNAGLNIYGKHISSKGKIKYQDYANTNLELNGFAKVASNLEVNGRVSGKQDRYNQYGYEPKNLLLPEDSVKVEFQTFTGRIGLRNIDRGSFGLSYAPEVKFDVFEDRRNNRETAAYFNLPLRKTIGGKFEADVALEGSTTRFSPQNKAALKTNWFSIAPSLLVKSNGVNLQAGIRPSWDNGAFKLFPNVMLQLSSPDRAFTILGGWIGYMETQSYQKFAGYNPYLAVPKFINNSRTEEIYGGVKGALTDHFNYNLKVGLNKYSNHPLFKNDSLTGRSFYVINKPNLKALNFSGEIGYTLGESFSLRSGIQLFRYFDLEGFERAWGLLPMEFKTSVRIQILRDLYVKGDLTAFDGAPYQTKAAGTGRAQGALDLGAGLEFSVVKNVKLWAQFNNILNKEYERWKQYPSYGFNFLGGIVFSFAKTNK